MLHKNIALKVEEIFNDTALECTVNSMEIF